MSAQHLLYVGTDDGLHILDENGEMIGHTLAGEAVRDVSVHPADPHRALVGCGLRGSGLYRVEDPAMEAVLLGFEDIHVWGVTRHPSNPEEVYIGTEPPGIYRRTASSDGFQSLEGIHAVASRDRWSFIHGPFHAGHVHGFAIHPSEPTRIFAGVEIGCVLRSLNRGATWSDRLAGADVHRIRVDPADPDRVWAMTATGVQCSSNGGETWAPIEAIEGYYCTDLLIDPAGIRYVSAGTAGTGDTVHIWANEGSGWRETAQLDTGGVSGVVAMELIGSDLLHVRAVDGGRHRLVRSEDGGQTWRAFGPELATVRTVCAVPR